VNLLVVKRKEKKGSCHDDIFGILYRRYFTILGKGKGKKKHYSGLIVALNHHSV
jgi:hypothetical protein